MNQKEFNSPKFKQAVILSHTLLATTYHFFTFEKEAPFTFQPGQYISVKVASDRINCYSLAGSDGPDKFSLLVDILPGGPGSQFFERLKVGDRIFFLGPLGTFTFHPDDGSKHLLFLATGCGLAPLKAIIENILKERKLNLPMTLYLSFRSSGDVFWQDYLQALSNRFPNFNYQISVDKGDDSWQGNIGFITELVKKDFPNADHVSAYLCGNKFMIADAIKILTERGCSPERIYTEKL